MSESVKQSLSALMDDEADQFEVRRVLQQLDGDSAQTWARYHLASAVLRGETPESGGLDVSVAVMGALEQEPSYRSQPANRGWLKPFGSVAVAASVTALVMFGAQTYQPDAGPAQLAENQSMVLPAPAARAELMPAQYGREPSLVSAPSLADADVIRLSSAMEYYIHQHHALMRERTQHWVAGWVPSGFQQVRHDVMPSSEVILYSNGRTAISVSVEPYGQQKAREGAALEDGTVALGKRVGQQFVTVVGDLPLMMADRIASSVAPAEY